MNKQLVISDVNERAIIEVVNFDKTTSWIRWYMPDFSDNGNIDLPKGNWEVKERKGNSVTLNTNKP